MKDWKAPRRASRVSTAARSIPFPASSRRSELFCHAQRRLPLTSEDGHEHTFSFSNTPVCNDCERP